jgi:hypothetical protein
MGYRLINSEFIMAKSLTSLPATRADFSIRRIETYEEIEFIEHNKSPHITVENSAN